jgi:hypothetical protein
MASNQEDNSCSAGEKGGGVPSENRGHDRDDCATARLKDPCPPKGVFGRDLWWKSG